jgi:hypothetical protein
MDEEPQWWAQDSRPGDCASGDHRSQPPLDDCLREGRGRRFRPPRPSLPARYRVTGPVARMTCWKATGGMRCEHLPADLAPMPTMLSWYLPLPLIPR